MSYIFYLGECLYKYPCSDKTYLVKSWEFKFNDAEKKKKREREITSSELQKKKYLKLMDHMNIKSFSTLNHKDGW